MGLTHKQRYNKRHGFDRDEGHSLTELAKISKYPKKTLQEVYDRGVGAHKTNLSSVRREGDFKKAPGKKLSAEQWAMARVYAFLDKIESGVKLNHDTDLKK